MSKQMEAHDFKKWRKSLGFSQRDAADALGLKRRMIQYYECGERDGEKVAIPHSIALACYAVAEGVESYRGPSKKVEWRDVKAKVKQRASREVPKTNGATPPNAKAEKQSA